jgi:hypothetical protein
MKVFEPTPELLTVAQRVVWFKEPEDALQEPVHFLAHAMRYGTADDLLALEKAGVGMTHYREVLDNAPAGIFDARSWNFWNLKCGKTTVPPLPVRKFDLG